MSVRVPTISARCSCTYPRSPFQSAAARLKRGQKMKVGVFGGEAFKLLAIVNVLLAARAKEQPELASAMTVRFRQQPGQHGSEWRDPGSGCDEHGVAQGRAQNKIAEGPLKRDGRAFAETTEIVRHKSILHAIQAEGDVPVLGRRRRDRICARHLLAIGSIGLYREPLPGNEAETGDSVHFEVDVFGEFRERRGAQHTSV